MCAFVFLVGYAHQNVSIRSVAPEGHGLISEPNSARVTIRSQAHNTKIKG